MLLLLPTTSALKRREVSPTVSSFSVSATTTAVTFASILLLLLLLRRDKHFSFVRGAADNHFLVGCADAAAGACATYNISTEAERGTGYCFFYVSALYTAMLRTSIAAVVVGCFCFCRLHCDIPVVVVDRAAVETGCMLEKYKMIAHLQCYKKRGYIRTWYVYKIFFFIFRLMRYTDVCFFSLSGVMFPRE